MHESMNWVVDRGHRILDMSKLDLRTLHWIGLDWTGLDWNGSAWIGLDRIGTSISLPKENYQSINKKGRKRNMGTNEQLPTLARAAKDSSFLDGWGYDPPVI